MATIFESFPGDKSIILEPRELFAYKLSLPSGWKNIAVGVKLSWTDTGNGNYFANVPNEDTFVLPYNIKGNQIIFGLSNSTELPYLSPNEAYTGFFIGLTAPSGQSNAGAGDQAISINNQKKNCFVMIGNNSQFFSEYFDFDRGVRVCTDNKYPASNIINLTRYTNNSFSGSFTACINDSVTGLGNHYQIMQHARARTTSSIGPYGNLLLTGWMTSNLSQSGAYVNADTILIYSPFFLRRIKIHSIYCEIFN